MKVIVADPSGACYGVERALSLAVSALSRAGGSKVYTLGPLIHNPLVVGDLEARGARVAQSVDEMDSGFVVIRSHGVPADEIELAKSKGLVVIDATCPHVAYAQQRVAELACEGRFVVIIGEHGHPEVVAIQSRAGRDHAVVEEVEEIPELPEGTRIGVVVQTTQSRERFERIVSALRRRFPDVEVSDTICSATKLRQEAAASAAAKADAVVVIGGRNSANTRRLAGLCRKSCPRTYHIESADEIDPQWFAGCEAVAVAAGASTPQNYIDATVAALERLA